MVKVLVAPAGISTFRRCRASSPTEGGSAFPPNGLEKRGGGAAHLNLDEVPDIGSCSAREVIALDDALNALTKIDPRKGQVIELRFFSGLSVEETAEVLKVSADTVMRDWRLARAWLLAEIGDPQNKQQ